MSVNPGRYEVFGPVPTAKTISDEGKSSGNWPAEVYLEKNSR